MMQRFRCVMVTVTIPLLFLSSMCLGKLVRFQSNRVVFDSRDAEPSPGSIVVDTDIGRIVCVTRGATTAPGEIETVDFGNLVIFPGLVDSHVHINDPGRDHWERFDCATKAALAGGTCTIGDMPLNCIPVTTTPEAYNAKAQAAENRLWADVGFVGGLLPLNADPAPLSALLNTGVVAVKAFMCYSGIDDYPGATLEDLDLAMPTLAARDMPLMVHAELECCAPSIQPSGDADHRRYQTFLDSRPDIMEVSAIDAIIDLAEKHDCPVHVVHLSSCKGLSSIRAARSRSTKITVETCPHYLCFSSEQIGDGQTLFKCCPPIRDSSNRDALWEALFQGHIDMIVSDHSPSSPDVKCLDTGNFLTAWGGIAGLQFRLLSIWTEGRKRGANFSHLCKWLCESPAKLIGFDHCKGRLRANYDADFVVWDPDCDSSVSTVHHLHPRTPYETMPFTGRVHFTYKRGQLAYTGATETFGLPTGQILQRF